MAFFATQIPNYIAWQTFTDISTGVEIIAVVAVGQTLVVLTRNIDLSIGSVVGLVAYFVGTLLASAPGLPAPAALAMAPGPGRGARRGGRRRPATGAGAGGGTGAGGGMSR